MLSRVALLAGLSGCSFVMMNNPSHDATTPPRCESQKVVPVIDAIGAVASIALATTVALAIRADDGPPLRSAAILGVGVGLGGTFAAASVVGFRRADRCRRAMNAFTASGR